MKTIDKLKEINPELVKELNMIIHDWRGLKLLLNTFSKKQNDPEYEGELTWDKQAKRVWDESHIKVSNHVEKMCDILYDK